jgi:hypothetical protein
MYIFYKAIANDKAIVEAIYQDHELTEEQKAEGVYVEDFPTFPAIPEGHVRVIYVNPQTLEFSYEDIKETKADIVQELKVRLEETEQKLQEAETRLAITEEALFQLMFGGIE